jgi:enterochelin esterase-like enzyme
MRNFRIFTMVSLLAVVIGCWAQPSEEQQSTVCNADGTVTFRYWNKHAKNVQVDVQFAGRKPMQRDADGVWTATLGPAAPDLYPYCFVVDGVSIMDPMNPQYFPNEGFKNSLLEIKNPSAPMVSDIKNVPHGRMEYIHYYSKSLGGTNNAIVYLPPGYMRDHDKDYPVFYLISGTTDTEEVYYKVGRVNYILDNLLAEDAAREMIVVQPYGNPSKLLVKQSEGQNMPQTRFGGDVFSQDLINDLMPYVEANYRTINDPDHRAIGGFSRGGNQALFNGLSHLDKFSYLCSYSSFTSTDIPGVYDNAKDTNSKINLFWLGVGTDDFLYGTARDYMEFLDKKGIRTVKELTTDKFGHTWMNARYFLDKTLRLLFNKKASKAAMEAGQPAPAATGKEQQFTPGVMARLFPKPIISPEYGEEGITFRFKAPEADSVKLACEMLPDPLPMERDSDGVWSVTLSGYLYETFEYCFLMDSTYVTDPQNMYILPSSGFKFSIADNPRSPFNFASMGDIPHGRVSYDLERSEAWYMSPQPEEPKMPVMIRLVPEAGGTMEDWFKIGGADAIADRLIADGKTKPCIITTSRMDFMQGRPQMPGFKVNTLQADDFPTWSQRRRALFKLLIDIGKQPDAEFPSFGNGQGFRRGGGFGRGRGNRGGRGNRRGGGNFGQGGDNAGGGGEN